MNRVDKVYTDLLKDILANGSPKETRSGNVWSVFGRQLRFDLKEGFPLLTTKKVFTKGVFHELLWFLKHPYNSHGSMNIEYLLRNGVHIWDDDAYRWYKAFITENIIDGDFKYFNFVVMDEDDVFGKEKQNTYTKYIFDDVYKDDIAYLASIKKDEFLELAAARVELRLTSRYGTHKVYRFGDLGPVYGKQWRSFEGVDQIGRAIDTLRSNPSDRRIICTALNPTQVGDMALPPCHVMFQFYTRELTTMERNAAYDKKHNASAIKGFFYTDKELDDFGVPRLGLSCMWTQRSVDTFLGLVWNIASYALLTHMVAEVCGMEVDELVGSLGDCHIYDNHVDAVREQLSREGYDTLPTLSFKGHHSSIDDFEYEDIVLEGYVSDPTIKAQLNVGDGKR